MSQKISQKKSLLLNHNGMRLNYYDPKTLELLKSEDLGRTFQKGSSYLSKNCQVSGNEVGICDGKEGIFIKNVESNTVEKLPEKHSGISSEVACLHSSFLFGGKTFMISGDVKRINLWDFEEKKVIKTFEDDDPMRTTSLLFLNKSKFVSGGYVESNSSYFTKMFDYNKLVEVKKLKDHACWIYSLCCSNDLLFTGAVDSKVNVYSIGNEMKKLSKIEYDNPLWSIGLVKEKKYLIAGDCEGFLHCSDIRKLKGFVFRERLSSSNEFIYKKKVHGEKNAVESWDDFSQGIWRILDNTENLKDSIVTGGADETIKLINVDNGKVLKMVKEKHQVHGAILFRMNKGKTEKQVEMDQNERVDFLIERNFLNSFSVQMKNRKIFIGSFIL